MTAARSVSIGVFLLVSCAVLVLFFGPPSAGQAPAHPPAAVGRYQLVVQQRSLYICDTQTGQIWGRVSPLLGLDKWTEIASPVMKEKK
jgi:hypothetical protein